MGSYQVHASRQIVLALGSNQTGPWGDPRSTVLMAIRVLQPLGVKIVRISPLGKSAAVGGSGGGSKTYVNAVIEVECTMSPAALLRLLKAVERKAGRRTRGRWTARTLDLDIIAFRGSRNFWPRRRAGSLTLPHPEAHWRAFVLAPLLAVAPQWHHNGLRVSGRRLLATIPLSERRNFVPLEEPVESH